MGKAWGQQRHDPASAGSPSGRANAAVPLAEAELPGHGLVELEAGHRLTFRGVEGGHLVEGLHRRGRATGRPDRWPPSRFTQGSTGIAAKGTPGAAFPEGPATRPDADSGARQPMALEPSHSAGCCRTASACPGSDRPHQRRGAPRTAGGVPSGVAGPYPAPTVGGAGARSPGRSHAAASGVRHVTGRGAGWSRGLWVARAGPSAVIHVSLPGESTAEFAC